MGKYTIKRIILTLITVLSFYSIANAVTPIAVYNTVNYQRINAGETINVGVVAFSKPGVEKVVFTIAPVSGTYGGTSPVTVTSLSNNPTTDLWEYWTPIDADDFSVDGEFTVTAVVTGNDAATKDLGALGFFANPGGTLESFEVWVDDETGNDSTCAVDNEEAPCLTIPGAIGKIQAASATGVSDGSFIYLDEGTWSIGNLSTTAVIKEWLTITKMAAANEANVIITSGGTADDSGNIHFKDITAQRTGSQIFTNLFSSYAAGTTYSKGDKIMYANPSYTGEVFHYVSKTSGNQGHTPSNANAATDYWQPAFLWFDSCTLIGSDYETENSSPIVYRYYNMYLTDNTITNIDCVSAWGTKLNRGNTMTYIGDDPCLNCGAFIDNTVTHHRNDVRAFTWHADIMQLEANGKQNPNGRVIFNNFCTDISYAGFVAWSSDLSSASNIAIVNNVLEFRNPGTVNEQGKTDGNGLAMGVPIEHFLFWHNTIVGARATFYGDRTNSSVVGNLIYSPESVDADIKSGNAKNNESAYNHFMYVNGITGACPEPWPDYYTLNSKNCPAPASEVFDTNSPVTYTTGAANIQSYDYPIPLDIETNLINRLPSKIVPMDILGNARDDSPDIGAFEYVASTPPVRSNGSPDGTISYATTVTLELDTAENATCKYGAVADTAYASIANTFETTGTTSHSQTGVAVSEGSNAFYVRCTDGVNPNTTDYTIDFIVEKQDLPVPSAPGVGKPINFAVGKPVNIR